MPWINLGDISPRQGTVLMEVGSAELDATGFRASAVETVCEATVGGSDSVFLLRHGDLFCSLDNLKSALAVLGASLDGDQISSPDHEGGHTLVDSKSDQGLRMLFMAVHAYAGIEDPSNILIRIGPPNPYDQGPEFTGTLDMYPEGTSLWAIMRNVFGDFDHDPKGTGAVATPYARYGIWEGLPREVSDRMDLIHMPAIAQLRTDDVGNPNIAMIKDDVLRAYVESLPRREFAMDEPGW